ncbi:MAG: hypothetical protein M3417_02920 [Actinomycetota bacterium]|nr:hypothetical protein [Actinomycetota bacterium]
MSDAVPTYSKPVVGYRVWRVDADGRLWPRAVGALARLRAQPWRPGDNLAECLLVHVGKAPHDAPRNDCDCGFYGWHEVVSIPRRLPDDLVAGAISGWGDLEVHEDGFRAERARVLALGMPEKPGGIAPAGARAATVRYGVPLVPIAELAAAAAPFGAALGPDARPPHARFTERVRRMIGLPGAGDRRSSQRDGS